MGEYSSSGAGGQAGRWRCTFRGHKLEDAAQGGAVFFFFLRARSPGPIIQTTRLLRPPTQQSGRRSPLELQS
jgi:hypothetical protein